MISTTSEPQFNISLSEPAISGNEWRYIKDCLDKGWVSSVGDYVKRFEELFAGYVNSKYAVATVNGTSALHRDYLETQIHYHGYHACNRDKHNYWNISRNPRIPDLHNPTNSDRYQRIKRLGRAQYCICRQTHEHIYNNSNEQSNDHGTYATIEP